MTTINRDEWIAALNEAGISDDNDQDAVTVPEFAAMMDMHQQTASRRLIALEKAGKATRTRKLKAAPDGRMMRYLAFRLVK